jgi:hypothetical protein
MKIPLALFACSNALRISRPADCDAACDERIAQSYRSWEESNRRMAIAAKARAKPHNWKVFKEEIRGKTGLCFLSNGIPKRAPPPGERGYSSDMRGYVEMLSEVIKPWNRIHCDFTELSTWGGNEDTFDQTHKFNV